MLLVKISSGISVRVILKFNSIWFIIRICVGFNFIRMIINDGNMVIVWCIYSGIWKWMNFCIIICFVSVFIIVEDSLVVIRFNLKIVVVVWFNNGCSVRYVLLRLVILVWLEKWNVVVVVVIIVRLTKLVIVMVIVIFYLVVE